MQIDASVKTPKQFVDTNTAPERHVLVTLDRTKLLLSQRAIRILTSMADVRHDDPPTCGIGWIEFQGGRWPVYGLADDLTLADTAPATRRICALLNADGGYIGIACSNVALLDRGVPREQPIPQPMAALYSPITALVKLEDGIACATTAMSLTRYVTRTSNNGQ